MKTVTEKLRKGELMKAIKDAMAHSLVAGGDKGAQVAVEVDHPLFKGYFLECRKGRMSRIQQWPSKLIRLWRLQTDGTEATVWSTEAGYLSSIVGQIVRDGSVEPKPPVPKALWIGAQPSHPESERQRAVFCCECLDARLSEQGLGCDEQVLDADADIACADCGR